MNRRHVIGPIVLAVLALGYAPCHGSEANTSTPVTNVFPSDGIRKLVVRAEQGLSATVSIVADGSSIRVSGVPTGGARGYHPADPNWQETPAAGWGLQFVGQRYGDILVVSTKNEIRYIHHYYFLADVRIQVPPGIQVVREQRRLTGSGLPDLGAP
jgi:hypothetical protein